MDYWGDTTAIWPVMITETGQNMIGVEAYKEVNKEIRNGMREAKEAWIQNKCCQLKDSISDNKT